MSEQRNTTTSPPDPDPSQDQAEAIDPEIIPPRNSSQAVERVPQSITELATIGGAGIQIIEDRKAILEHAVKASILLTYPEDWTLFKDTVSGRVTAYVGDNGCKRFIGLWQIQATPEASKPERSELGQDFAFTYRGDAYSKLTNTWVYDVEGTRVSTDQYARQSPEGLMREVRVKQAAKANFEGNCVRKLAGLQSVPESFLNEVWKGTGKTTAKCAGGRGFGTRAEREGAELRSEATPEGIEAPICEAEKCGRTMKFYAAGTNDRGSYPAVWKCPEYKWDSKTRSSLGGHSKIDADDYAAKLRASAGSDTPKA